MATTAQHADDSNSDTERGGTGDSSGGDRGRPGNENGGPANGGAGGGIEWRVLGWDDLTLDELYSVLALRCEVFVVEQDSPFLDPDGRDQVCTHVLGTWPGGDLAAYARIVPAGALHDHAVSIGRVVTSLKARGQGLGVATMTVALDHLRAVGNALPIEIEAQHRLERFYEGFGFRSVGEPYVLDRVLHVAMVRDPDAT